MSLPSPCRRSRAPFRSLAGLALIVLAPSASAQFNDAWLTLAQDVNRLKNPDGSNADLIANPDEKDFAVADVDRDGWLDIAVAKKIQVSFVGPREGRFLHNEKGTLVDRTQQFATASTVGDQGFKTALDTRDVEFVDVTGDGWLDMVTCQTDLANHTAAAAKDQTHPRVYVNLGDDANGNWLGFRYESARIPQLLTSGGLNGVVRFCDLAFGDLDADGDQDLYFVDYDTDENGHIEPATLDLNDRLLINDGAGYFSDATATHLAPGFSTSTFGTECDIEDLNGDGRLDILKVTTLGSTPNRAECLYNDLSPVAAPNFTGGCDVKSTVDSTGANYTMANADLNNDGRIDHIAGDDVTDHYRFNTGNSALGTVIWSTALNFSWLSGSGDDGFPGQIHTADFDRDGWRDVILCDVDIDLPGCDRRTKIYHNRGGTVGGTNIVLREEKEMAGASGWFGAVGWNINNARGVNDSALGDFDNDGDIDIVLGRCVGTEYWSNQDDTLYCEPQIAPTSNGDFKIAMCGKPLWSNLVSNLSLRNGPAFGSAIVIVSLSTATTPAFGGQVLSSMQAVFPLPLDGNGGLSIPVPGGGGTVAGTTIHLQAIAGMPFEVSNILSVTFHD